MDPFVAIQEIDMPSQSVTCGLDSDGDGILDSMVSHAGQLMTIVTVLSCMYSHATGSMSRYSRKP